MKKYWVVLVFLLLALAGCGSGYEAHNSNASDELPKEVKVEIKTIPEAIQTHENIEVQAIVTQDGKAVNDADEVKFEVWKDGSQQREMLVATAKGDGVYAIEKAFSEDAVYHITAHTTAREMHVMPTVQITVGAGQAAAPTKESNHHHTSDVTISLMDAEVKAGSVSTLQVHIQQSGAALTGADVNLEIWKNGNEKHEYIPAKEGVSGQYEGSFTFEPGVYHVNVHVVKGELHEHKEQTITVQ